VVSLIINHGRMNIEAAELRQIVGLAYAVQRIRVLGGPGWADSSMATATWSGLPFPISLRLRTRSVIAWPL
jgi:hypothetical protein